MTMGNISRVSRVDERAVIGPAPRIPRPQGVAYLDDGTMVVVDDARKMISKTIDIVVTSVLQTTAGKMIFGRYIEQGVAPQPAEQQRPRAVGSQQT